MRAAILLAAGSSRRFGHADKLRALLGGRSLLERAVANARAARAHRLIVVVQRPLRLPGAAVVRADRARYGLAESLKAGLAALRPIEREALIFLADMPFARAPRMRLQPGRDAVRPVFAGKPGHPMLVRIAAARAREMRGDRGLGGSLSAALVRGTRANLFDIDTRAALRAARLRFTRR